MFRWIDRRTHFGSGKRFARYIHDKEQQTLQELEDLRHLYAHNFAGEADDVYFRFRAGRHILKPDVPIELSCGALFNGRQVALKLPDLRMYSDVVQRVAARV